MADDSIFGNPEVIKPAEQAQVTPVTATPGQQGDQIIAESPQIADPYAHLLAGIHSDDGRQKYANTEDALKALPHAQKYIQELSSKVKELEQKEREAANVEDIIKRVESQQAKQETPSEQSLDETKLAQMFDTHLTNRERAAMQKANQQDVVKSLSEAYGEKAEEQYVAKATELGIDVEVLNNLARTSPKAALAYFSLQHKPSTSGFKQASVNTEAMDMKPTVTVDPLDRFKSTDSELLKKWRKAVQTTEG